MADDRRIKAAVDLISNLPDEILQQILCFIPIKVAIKTSLLSKRWRHVWCDIPSLTLDVDSLTAASVTETLTHYTAPKTKIFFLKATKREDIPHIDQWIKCAMSHNVENLSLDFPRPYYEEYKPFLDLGNSFCEGYKLPGFFYNSSSFKQLNIKLSLFGTMVSKCSVSWTSLQKLSLSRFRLSDESMAKILSGCPVLENLTLYHIRELKLPCTLVDVSSLTEAKLDICHVSMNPHLTADFLQVMALKMLEKFQNAEKLSFGGNFILILSLAEIRGVPFPMLKVKSLILDTVICQYVIPGVERLLQNSPDLEKLIVRGRNYNTIPEEHVDIYLKLKTLNPDQCWRSKDGFAWNKSCWNVQPKQVASFVELVLINTEKSLKLVVLLDERPYL
ncbi:putative F-box/LRR-repeat protein At3g18150 [Brassica napus]|uniref:putative F-box/LRR-repeat protein At3g18150 n=1 Tax=Brassica napus TaxID=3708 RepID=UPI002078BE3E|nr:putative F-box/LRR-repeat protein At3g18150 [Brassica napus]XP_048635083.1 putative F-box/LRR-repeat protein At3g18150 [Brassica napus]